jgi:hypothetical protein
MILLALVACVSVDDLVGLISWSFDLGAFQGAVGLAAAIVAKDVSSSQGQQRVDSLELISHANA